MEKRFLCFLMLIFTFTEGKNYSSTGNRGKRYLIYPLNGSKLQLIFGTGIPIHLEKITPTIGWVIKSAYKVPTDPLIYTDPYVVLERKRSLNTRSTTRYSLYRALEENLLRISVGSKDCLLKAICEVSRIPLIRKSLIGNIIYVILSPSSTDEMPNNDEESQYHIAEDMGRTRIDECTHLYPSCSLNLVQMFTHLYFS